MKHRINITDPRAIHAIELYKSGMRIKPICKQLKMDGATLNRFLDELGIKKSRSEMVRGGKSKAVINDNALDILTPEALYWIGFLYADGHIEKDRPRIALTLSEVDKNHLQKFASFFGKDLQIRKSEGLVQKNTGYVSQPTYRVSFSSKIIYERLVGLGFTSRKTWSTIPPTSILSNSRDFWRGVVDGDGSLCTRKYNVASLYLCGQESTLKGFSDFIRSAGIITEAQIRKEPKREFLWTFVVTAKKARDVAQLLYQDSSIYLDRKYEKYLSWIK